MPIHPSLHLKPPRARGERSETWQGPPSRSLCSDTFEVVPICRSRKNFAVVFLSDYGHAICKR
jgi:hypothetical protein